MEILILIIGTLSAVSLYDFFSSRKWQQITSSTRNEIVFNDRNKKYGAYEIRKNYDKTIIMILFSLVATIGASYGAYLFVRELPEDTDKIVTVDYPIPFIWDEEDDLVVDIPIKKEEVENVTETLKSQIDFRTFNITDDEVNTSINTQDLAMNNKIGDKDVIIDDEENLFKEPIAKKKEVVETIKDDVPFTILDEDPEYPGGYKEMVRFLSSNMQYPELPRISGIQGKANVRFIVEKNGVVQDVKVTRGVPNCDECDKEAIRVVKKMPQWKPGKINGQPVRSYFNLPVTFAIK